MRHLFALRRVSSGHVPPRRPIAPVMRSLLRFRGTAFLARSPRDLDSGLRTRDGYAYRVPTRLCFLQTTRAQRRPADGPVEWRL